jgi:hypothetical protein
MIANCVKAGLVYLGALAMSDNSAPKHRARRSRTSCWYMELGQMVPAERAFTTSLLRLIKDGFNVSIVQELETSCEDEVTATKRVLALQDGRSILVAHSYGGAVIMEAGTDPSVAGLVYVAAAHMPDAVELLC